MAYSDFDDEKAIESVYCTELENYFEKTLGAKKVRALDYQVSSALEPIKYMQAYSI